MRLVLGEDEYFGHWIQQKLPVLTHLKDYTAIGILDDSGTIVGGVLYNNYFGHDIQMTIATESPKWCSRLILKALFTYPFDQLGCERVTAITAKNNKKARKMLERLGFTLEGVVRKGYDGKQNACLYGMLKNECKWRFKHG